MSSSPEPLRAALPRNLALALLGTAALFAGRFVAVVVLSKFASAELLGQFNWSVATAGVVVALFMFGLRAVLIADPDAHDAFGSYRAARRAGMLAATVVLAAMAGRAAASGAGWAFVLIFLGVGLGRVFDALGEIYWGLCQKHERMEVVGWAGAARGALMAGAYLVVVPLVWWLGQVRGGQRPEALAAAVAGASVLCAALWGASVLLVDVRLARRTTRFDASWSARSVTGIVLKSLPLGIVTLLISLTAAIPVWAIERLHRGAGFAYVGYFSALSCLALAGQLLVAQLGHAASNRLSTLYRESPSGFGQLLAKLLATAAVLGLALLLAMQLCGAWLLAALYAPAYAAYHAPFMVMMAAQALAFVASILGFAATQMQLYWPQVAVWSLMALASHLVAEWRVPSDPVGGGAATMLAAAMVQLVGYAAVVAAGVARRRRSTAMDARTIPPGAAAVWPDDADRVVAP